MRQGKRDLTVIANDTAMPGRGIGKLVSAGLVGRTVASHIELNPETQQQMIAGHRCRSHSTGHAYRAHPSGRLEPAGSTPTGVGTVTSKAGEGSIDGKSYLLETALRADFALVHTFLADYLGNLALRLTARNFNPVIAMAGNTVIVTAEHIVPVGVIAPDHVMTPAPIVDYIIAKE